MTDTDTDPDPDVVVPPDDSPAARCPRCDRPFRSERACTLHVAEAHDERIAGGDRTEGGAAGGEGVPDHEEAREAEAEELFFYHMKVIVVIAAVQIVLVIVYLIVFG